MRASSLVGAARRISDEKLGPGQPMLVRGLTDKKRGIEEIDDQEEVKTNKLDCNICCEEITEKKAELNCGHFFCMACITKWAEIENTCPYCKQEFTKIIEKAIGKSPGHNKRRPPQRMNTRGAKHSRGVKGDDRSDSEVL